MFMRKLFPIIILVALTAFKMTAAGAQEKKEAPATWAELSDWVESSCLPLISRHLSGLEFSLVAGDHPFDISATCKCTAERFRSDTRLENQFNVQKFSLFENKSDNVHTYLVARLTSSTLACFAAQLDKELKVVDISK